MADKVLRPVEYSDETQELLRNSLLKLNARIGDLGPIENVKGCSFNYQIFVNERGAKAVTDNHTEVRKISTTFYVLQLLSNSIYRYLLQFDRDYALASID